MRAYHDIGGLPGGPIDKTVHDVPDWALLAEGLRGVLGERYRLHEQRRVIEELGPELYAKLGYFELRVEAMARILSEKGIVTAEELDARYMRLKDRKASSVGDENTRT